MSDEQLDLGSFAGGSISVKGVAALADVSVRTARQMVHDWVAGGRIGYRGRTSGKRLPRQRAIELLDAQLRRD